MYLYNLLDIIKRIFPPLLVIYLLGVVVKLFVSHCKHEQVKLWPNLIWPLFFTSLCAVVMVTLVERTVVTLPEELTLARSYLKLNPLEPLRQAFRAGTLHGWSEIGLNFLLMLPSGLLFAYMFPHKRQFRSPLVFFSIFSLSIEILQYVSKRGIASVLDVITNVSGAMYGFSLYLAIEAVVLSRQQKSSLAKMPEERDRWEQQSYKQRSSKQQILKQQLPSQQSRKQQLRKSLTLLLLMSFIVSTPFIYQATRPLGSFPYDKFASKSKMDIPNAMLAKVKQELDQLNLPKSAYLYKSPRCDKRAAMNMADKVAQFLVGSSLDEQTTQDYGSSIFISTRDTKLLCDIDLENSMVEFKSLASEARAISHRIAENPLDRMNLYRIILGVDILGEENHRADMDIDLDKDAHIAQEIEDAYIAQELKATYCTNETVDTYITQEVEDKNITTEIVHEDINQEAAAGIAKETKAEAIANEIADTCVSKEIIKNSSKGTVFRLESSPVCFDRTQETWATINLVCEEEYFSVSARLLEFMEPQKINLNSADQIRQDIAEMNYISRYGIYVNLWLETLDPGSVKLEKTYLRDSKGFYHPALALLYKYDDFIGMIDIPIG